MCTSVGYSAGLLCLFALGCSAAAFFFILLSIRHTYIYAYVQIQMCIYVEYIYIYIYWCGTEQLVFYGFVEEEEDFYIYMDLLYMRKYIRIDAACKVQKPFAFAVSGFNCSFAGRSISAPREAARQQHKKRYTSVGRKKT